LFEGNKEKENVTILLPDTWLS